VCVMGSVFVTSGRCGQAGIDCCGIIELDELGDGGQEVVRLGV